LSPGRLLAAVPVDGSALDEVVPGIEEGTCEVAFEIA
jgi:hypothetical protein